ncbi:N-acetylmuramoyl-L-alanine amidase [Wenyingzhuangia sp. chi5]|uniref:N-acetylmuramoyl-L-alanine amidase n=1 Tax=Wenyingzhuangia gilva TaxID=3057677 RepID=A0ABT8VN31_9FLAO|nr:N-acetylmuramoyl-L-alanine amidase [Wenyingzhuangia sp. chi5]MDO3693357.1 N-acetylmuramoyl-L-alanine amidase [Wenyingzhuangia sp. chi5]
MITDVSAQKHEGFIVVLDAGHGGKDPGKVGYKGAKEKDVALNIVLKTGKILSTIPGVKVMYTRTTDVFVDLWKRGDIANDADADLFVSVHCNAHTSQAIGAETWVLSLKGNDRNFRVAKAENEVILQEENHQERYQGFDPSNPTSVIGLSLEQEENLDQSLLLASLIQTEFEKSLNRVNRGVKQAGFVVLYQTYMPSVLIETGFLTNRIEGQYLYSAAGQQQMASSIAKSVQKYLQRQQLNVAANDFYDGDVISSPNTSNVASASENIGTYYKVQLASSKNRISTSSYNFKGLKDVERVQVDGFYKYYLGRYNNKQEANTGLSLAKSKGYKTAFVVGFNDEVKATPHSITEQLATPKVVNNAVSKVYYKVQIASSTNKISTSPSNFKGLDEVEAVKVGNYYKYYLGKTSSYDQAKKYLASAKSKKYSSAFVVAFLNDERITLKEALKRQTN